MSSLNNRGSGRWVWLISAGVAALIAAALRYWQLNTAFVGGSDLAVLKLWELGGGFEHDAGLAIPGAQASVMLVCVLVMAGAWFVLLALRQPMPGQTHRWELVFLGAGDPIFPGLEIAAALLAILSVPVLFIVGVNQFQLYQECVAARIQPPSNNGMLTLATAAGAFLAALGLLQMGRDGLRPGRRGRGGFAAALPGVAGCVWLMESFRSHAANPVLWDYVPQIIAIVLGMMLYMDFAGMSAGVAKPRRLLWIAGMTVVFSAAALVSTATELSALSGLGRSLLCAPLGDLLLLLAQMLAAVGVLWRLPVSMGSQAKPRPARPNPTQEIQEENVHE